MFLILAAATNDLTSGSPPEKFTIVLVWPAVVWAIVFTFIWDWVELWTRGLHFKFFRTPQFWMYFGCHAFLSSLATAVLGKTVGNTWLIGLLAAVSNEMVLSNTNITFGTANILPLLDLFKKLRVLMQEKIDRISNSVTRELMERLSKLPLPTLEEKLVALLIQNGKQPKDIKQQLADLRVQCDGDDKILAIKLANDLIQLDPDVAKKLAG